MLFHISILLYQPFDQILPTIHLLMACYKAINFVEVWLSGSAGGCTWAAVLGVLFAGWLRGTCVGTWAVLEVCWLASERGFAFALLTVL
jgi:hypothetical protein